MNTYSAGALLLLKLIQDKESWAILDELGISEDCFYNPADKALFLFCEKHNIQYGKLPDISVVLRHNPDIKSIVKLPNEPVDFFVDTFRHKFIQVTIKEFTEEARSVIENDNIDSDEFMGAMNELVSRLASFGTIGNTVNRLMNLSEGFGAALTMAINRRKKGSTFSGASFGFEFLDLVTDGGQDGDFLTIAARPENGKTHIMLNSANATYDSGKNPMIATFEMPIEQLSRRLIERRTNIGSKKLKFGNFTSFAERRIREHIVDLSDLEHSGRKMSLFQGSIYTTTATLAEKVSRVKPGALYVDGAYLLKTSRRGGSAMWERVSEGAEFLKSLALDLKIPVFATYQLNKQGKGKNAGLDTIMYSDSMAQFASIALTIKKPEDINDSQSTQWGGSLRRILQIDKGRDGEAATVEVDLSFGKKPFRVTRIISGDLSHIGYGKGDLLFGIC